jgi:hypothetical protein
MMEFTEVSYFISCRERINSIRSLSRLASVLGQFSPVGAGGVALVPRCARHVRNLKIQKIRLNP